MQTVGKADWQISNNHSLVGRILLTGDSRAVPHELAPDFLLNVGVAGRRNLGQSYTIGDTWLVSPETVVSGRLAVHYTDIHRIGPQFFNAADLGVQGFYSYQPKNTNVTVTDGFNLGLGTETDSRLRTFTVGLTTDASLSRGNHQWSLGGALSQWHSNSNGNVFSMGVFTFNGSKTGLGLADFMIGRLTTFRQATPNTNYMRKWYTAAYVADSWKFRPRWTLSYGLRWEPDIPEYLTAGRLQNFSEERRSAGIRSTVFKNAPLGFYYPGDPGYPGRRGRSYNWGVFAPRFGLAWDVNGDGRTSVRASTGIGYDYPNIQIHLWTSISPPWGLDIVVNDAKFDNPWAGIPGGSPFPAVFDENARFVPFGGFTVMPYELDPSQVQSWNLSVQRQVAEDWLVSASYIGSHTVHMLMTAPLNPAIYVPGVGDGRGDCFLNGQVLNFTVRPGAPCSTTRNTDQRRQLSLIDLQNTGQWVGPIAEYQSVGNAGYHGMLLEVRKRAARGVTLNWNYTWSHCISPERDTLNGSLYAPQATYTFVGDRDRGRANCTSDRRHITNLSAVAEMPRFANDTLRKVASGWRLSAIYRYSTGSYMTITAGPGLDLARNGTNPAGQPANQVQANPYGDPSGRPRSQWFNIAAFAQPAVGTFGNMGVRSVQGPSQWDFDMALSRIFQVREGQRLEVRAEAYNVPNSFRPTNPSSALNNRFFGILQNSRDPRILQFALKYIF
jgi:hypothetical protein